MTPKRNRLAKKRKEKKRKGATPAIAANDIQGCSLDLANP
jgi:hypothetical protein